MAGAAAEVPAADAVAEEVQPEPSLAGDVAGGASESSDSGTKDEAGAKEVEEEEDLFASGTDEGADDAADGAAGQKEEDLFAFPDEGGPPPVAPS